MPTPEATEPSSLVISKSERMRRKYAAGGYSIGDIGRLFNVSYHHAYSAIKQNAGAIPRQHAEEPTGQIVRAGNRSVLLPEFDGLSDEVLFEMTKRPGFKSGALRIASSKYLDEVRYAGDKGAWMDRRDKWERENRS